MSNEGEPIWAQQSILMTPILKTTKLKIPSYVPGFPPMFFPLVGMIALAWGSYEVFFNRLLAALIIATGDTSIPGWRFLDYKRRRAHCRKRLSDVLSSEQPAKNYLLKVLDDSAELHKKRNAILHGKLSARLYTTVPPRVELLTEARENGRLIQLAFSEDDLETLGYEIYASSGAFEFEI